MTKLSGCAVEPTDADLIGRIQKFQCSDSVTALRRRHAALVKTFVERYRKGLETCGLCVQDILDDADYLVYIAANTFDVSKGSKYSTWLANKVRFHCLKAMTATRQKQASPTAEESERLLDELAIASHETAHQEILGAARFLLDHFHDPRIKQAIELRYDGRDKPLSFKVVGQQMGVAKQTAVNLHNKGMKFLRAKLAAKENCDIS